MKQLLFIIFIFKLIGFSYAWAEDSNKSDPNEKCEYRPFVINLQVENDMFGGSDRHYTHGQRLAFVSDTEGPCVRENTAKVEGLFRSAGTWIEQKVEPVIKKVNPDFMGFNTKISISGGLNIFTPENIAEEDLIENDRPYAGWLYLGFGFISDSEEKNIEWSFLKTIFAKKATLDNFEVNIGIVGPWSFAEETQTEWHQLFGLQNPNGWNRQLKNEPGLVISYERKWRLVPELNSKIEYDFTPNLGVSLGNVYTNLVTGATLRIGQNLRTDYGPPRIRPGLQGSDFFQAPKGFSWYLFAGAEGRVVGRNIFLDGNTFTDSHSVEKENLVGDLQTGIVLSYGNFRFGYTNIFRTKEFDLQQEEDDFGSFNLSYRF